MELAWRGYGISIQILTTQAEDTPDPTGEETSQPASAQQRAEEVEKRHLLASGSRYVGPAR